MDGKTQSLLVVSGAVAALGGFLFWRWRRKRGLHSHGGHHHGEGGHGHGHHGPSLFNDVNVWMGFHYASPDDYVVISPVPEAALDYPVRLANICKKQKSDGVPSRALDIGCNVGRVCFELATTYNDVIGVDTSESAISAANQLRKEGEAPYTLYIEGKIVKEYKAVVNPAIDRSRVRFILADGCDLPTNIGQFGLVVISNTLHHLPDPKEFLEQARDLVAPSGILVIAEIYHWHEMMDLPKDRWIAGYRNSKGEDVTGFDGLKRCLSSHFALVEEDDLQSLVRFGPRMYNLAVPHVTVWMRKRL